MLKKTCLAIAAAYLGLAPISAANAQIFTGVDYIVTFYDDAAKTNQVGSRLVFCDGSFSQEGTLTQFQEYTYYYGCGT